MPRAGAVASTQPVSGVSGRDLGEYPDSMARRAACEELAVNLSASCTPVSLVLSVAEPEVELRHPGFAAIPDRFRKNRSADSKRFKLKVKRGPAKHKPLMSGHPEREGGVYAVDREDAGLKHSARSE